MYGVALLALVACLQDPVIDGAHTLTDGQARSGCWLPVEVTVRAPAGFDGDVVLVASPVTVAKAVRLAVGERRAIVVPALPLDVTRSIEIELRSGGVVRASRRLDERVTLVSEGGRLVARKPASWGDLDPAYFEAVDAIEGEAWTPRARFGLIEPASLPLRGEGEWIGTKRDAAVFFIVVYAFAGFVVLLALQRRRAGPRSAIAALASLAVFFGGAFFVLFPRGRVAVRAWAIIADGVEYRFHVARGGPVTYAQLAKPVFESFQRLPARVDVRIDGGCTVIGSDAVLTAGRAPAVGGTVPAAADSSDVLFYAPHFTGAGIARMDERDPPLTGVTAPGLVETRLEARLVAVRNR